MMRINQNSKVIDQNQSTEIKDAKTTESSVHHYKQHFLCDLLFISVVLRKIQNSKKILIFFMTHAVIKETKLEVNKNCTWSLISSAYPKPNYSD